MKTAKDLELLLLIKEHEKQKLQLRIHKAIEYIKNIVLPYGNEWHWDNAVIEDFINYVLEILEGEENGKN